MPEELTGVKVEANNVTLRDFALQGGVDGVTAVGAEDNLITGLKIENLKISELRGKHGEGGGFLMGYNCGRLGGHILSDGSTCLAREPRLAYNHKFGVEWSRARHSAAAWAEGFGSVPNLT